MDKAEKAFRELREYWFSNHLRSQLPERAWESDVDETLREEFNRALKVHFDDDTEAILRGENRPIAPTCAAEID